MLCKAENSLPAEELSELVVLLCHVRVLQRLLLDIVHASLSQAGFLRPQLLNANCCCARVLSPNADAVRSTANHPDVAAKLSLSANTSCDLFEGSNPPSLLLQSTRVAGKLRPFVLLPYLAMSATRSREKTAMGFRRLNQNGVRSFLGACPGRGGCFPQCSHSTCRALTRPHASKRRPWAAHTSRRGQGDAYLLCSCFSGQNRVRGSAVGEAEPV